MQCETPCSLKHGVFTYYLLRSVHGGADEDSDGRNTPGELYGYVEPNVKSFASGPDRAKTTSIITNNTEIALVEY
jgi:uncharacterized caspase-like protein